MKTILILEDSSCSLQYLKNILSTNPVLSRCLIIGCSGICSARDYFDKNKKDICCVITDLNLDDGFIDDIYIDETMGGMFSGWVWIKHYVYDDENRIPIIVCSGYVEYLRKYLGEEACLKLEEKNISFVQKEKGYEKNLMGKLSSLLT